MSATNCLVFLPPNRLALAPIGALYVTNAATGPKAALPIFALFTTAIQDYNSNISAAGGNLYTTPIITSKPTQQACRSVLTFLGVFVIVIAILIVKVCHGAMTWLAHAHFPLTLVIVIVIVIVITAVIAKVCHDLGKGSKTPVAEIFR